MKNKKGLILPIVISSVGVILSVGMIVGTSIAYQYEGLLNTFFQTSNYKASTSEKETCEKVGEEGTVLLKNEDNCLPLAKGSKVATFGQNSVDFVYAGSGSGSVDTSICPNFKEAVEEKGLKVDENLWNFYKSGNGSSYRKSFKDTSGQGTFAVNEVPIDVLKKDSNATKTLSNNDVAIVNIGRSGGESSDLPTNKLDTGYLYLQVDDNEKDTIKYACSQFSKVILIVNANNPVELGFLEDEEYQNVKACLWIGGVGQEGLYGLADVLVGNASPSGRLPDTYAYDSTSAPSFNNFGNYSFSNADSNTSRADTYMVYGEGIYVGYRYYETRYEDKVLNTSNVGDYDYSTSVQFPFGYGLSYSEFEYSNFDVKDNDDGTKYIVSLNVKNVGSVKSKEVVQIYGQKPYTGLVETSSIELAGFYKTDEIEAGESVDVEIEVDKDVFASYDYKTNGTYIVDKGAHYLSVGHNSHDALNNILASKGYTKETNGMDENGDSTLAKLVLDQQNVDTTTFKTSQNNYEVKNQFEDCDLNLYDSSYKYLSRSSWTETLTSSADYKNKSWEAPEELIENLKWNRNDEVINDTSLSTCTLESKSTSYTVEDLIGLDIEDEKYQKIVEQLSWSQISKLVRIGGYSTQAIDSINLPATQDKDGTQGFSGTLVGGVSTMSWPAEVVLAATWNTSLIEKAGEYIGNASIQAGVTGWYAPGADIHRSPYSGRNFEYFSEDPILTGKIGAAEMNGVRSKGVVAYLKHFALNDQETNRYGVAIFSNEQQIREISLKGFEEIIENSDSVALMVGMNRVGTTWAGAHKGLMTEVLRNEWGFKGVAITDQASVSAMYYQDIISGLWAGTDLWLNSNSKLWGLSQYDESIGGLKTGTVNYKDNNTVTYHLQRAAKRIIYAITNSNAVQTYDETVESSSSVFNWKALLYSVDGIIWVGSVAAIAILWVRYFLKAKKKNIEVEEEK